MTREEKIQWMITRTGWNPKAFEDMTDEEIDVKYNKIMEERS